MLLSHLEIQRGAKEAPFLRLLWLLQSAVDILAIVPAADASCTCWAACDVLIDQSPIKTDSSTPLHHMIILPPDDIP